MLLSSSNDTESSIVGFQMVQRSSVGMVSCNLASYYVFIPRSLTIIIRPTRTHSVAHPHAPTPLCDYYSDPIKFETVPREAGAPRDRAYWRGERSFLFALVSTRTLSVPFVILLQFVGFSSPF